MEIFHWMCCQVEKKKKDEKTPDAIETNHELFFYFEIGKLQPHLQLAGKERNTCAFYQRGVYFTLAFETSSKQHTPKLKPSSSALFDATVPAGLRNVQVAGSYLPVLLLHPWIHTSIARYRCYLAVTSTKCLNTPDIPSLFHWERDNR